MENMRYVKISGKDNIDTSYAIRHQINAVIIENIDKIYATLLWGFYLEKPTTTIIFDGDKYQANSPFTYLIAKFLKEGFKVRAYKDVKEIAKKEEYEAGWRLLGERIEFAWFNKKPADITNNIKTLDVNIGNFMHLLEYTSQKYGDIEGIDIEHAENYDTMKTLVPSEKTLDFYKQFVAGKPRSDIYKRTFLTPSHYYPLVLSHEDLDLLVKSNGKLEILRHIKEHKPKAIYLMTNIGRGKNTFSSVFKPLNIDDLDHVNTSVICQTF